MPAYDERDEAYWAERVVEMLNAGRERGDIAVELVGLGFDRFEAMGFVNRVVDAYQDDPVAYYSGEVYKALKAGRKRSDIVLSLCRSGFDSREAAVFVDDLADRYERGRRRGGGKALVWGVGSLVVGLGVTMGSYYLAGPGGFYVVFWSPVVFGLALAIGGAWTFLRSRDGGH